MTAFPSNLPLAGVPFDIKFLERDVVEMERMVELLRRRDDAAAALRARGVEFTIDQLKPRDIMEIVARRRNVSVAQIRGRERSRGIAWARHEVFYLMSIQVKANGATRWSLPEIGRRVGGEVRPFDHTTVLWGVRRHLARIEAAKRGEEPVYSRTGPRPRAARIPVTPAAKAAPSVCMLPAHLTCPGCGAPGGEACFDGARRG